MGPISQPKTLRILFKVPSWTLRSPFSTLFTNVKLTSACSASCVWVRPLSVLLALMNSPISEEAFGVFTLGLSLVPIRSWHSICYLCLRMFHAPSRSIEPCMASFNEILPIGCIFLLKFIAKQG